MTPRRITAAVALIATLAFSTQGNASQKKTVRPKTPPVSTTPPPAKPNDGVEETTSSRAIGYAPHDVVRLNLRMRYTTLIVLPKDEVILDFVCGDKDLWIVEGEQNFAYVKPAKEGASTNLNLVTASGNVYSFVLNEVTGTKNNPDLKVFVTLTDSEMTEASQRTRRLVSAQELDQCREQTENSRDETREVKKQAEEAIDRGIAQFVTNVRFAYRFEAGRRPFFVRAMYYDPDREITYIQARPDETPTLLELRDGKANLVNFTYKNGVYVVEKILGNGYLAIGRAKLPFTREE